MTQADAARTLQGYAARASTDTSAATRGARSPPGQGEEHGYAPVILPVPVWHPQTSEPGRP